MPVVGGKFLKSTLAASKPPAEAPMATIGNLILLFGVEGDEDSFLLICYFFQILVPLVHLHLVHRNITGKVR
jgi:hypothetical protein